MTHHDGFRLGNYVDVKFDPTPLIGPAREAMIRMYRARVILWPDLFALGPRGGEHASPAAYVSAIDLGQYLDLEGVGAERRWSGVVFRSPPGLWRRVGYIPNPRRHDSPTPLFELVEERARQLGL